jgi:hypothetical protein
MTCKILESSLIFTINQLAKIVVKWHCLETHHSEIWGFRSLYELSDWFLELAAHYAQFLGKNKVTGEGLAVG